MKYKVSGPAELKAIIAAKFGNRDIPEDSYFLKFKNTALNDLDVSGVVDMSYLFINCHSFNESISEWDVSNVVNMDGMFQSCYKFNQPLDNWDVSNVQTMELMFYKALDFNQNINHWDVSNIQDTRYAFFGAINFNQPLDNWDVKNLRYMNDMFSGCLSFNQDLRNWNLSEDTKFSNSFNNCEKLDFSNLENIFRKCRDEDINKCFSFDFIKNKDKAQLVFLMQVFGRINAFQLKVFERMDRDQILNMVRLKYCFTN